MTWAQSNLLKLNDQKTDVGVFGTKHKWPVMKDIRITVGGSTLSPSSHVRNLGVIFDSTLTMTNHISTICRTAYMHLHNISRIRRYLTPEATKSLVHAFIMSRLDYGNALLAGLPLEHLKELQRIQNIAARIITFTPRRDHITPILKQLHWLPIKRRIELKNTSARISMHQRHGTAVSCRHAKETMLDRPHAFFTATPVGCAADKARELSVSVSASYCIPQCVRLIAGVCTHYVVYNINKKKNTVDKSKIKDKRKVKQKDKSWVKIGWRTKNRKGWCVQKR